MTALAYAEPVAAVRPRSLDELPTITLEQLLSQAELQTRIDRKYLVEADAVPTLLGQADADLRVLSIAGRRRFAYRSTYFDTPELDAFLLAGRGRRRRFKVRTRVYRDSGEAWLEVKTRGPRGTTVKDRMPYDLADAGRLTTVGLDFIAATLAAQEVFGVDVAALQPTLHTGYDRSTLLVSSRTSDQVSRATIDSNLVWRRPGSEHSLATPGSVIIETKGGATASAIDRALWYSGVRPSCVSKYGAGLAALGEDLPELKWRRALNQLNPE
ncbi:MAG TPA: polyphosphate polymerase domain-containing protein [Propionicimonas sp.]|nr:polyphosphate polymerase domain-containing protein [Propionicimonas sp.]